ncbi:amino acid adenylation domain-containing protein [Streptomyces tsukubensis]|uniref:amino acid adenylation domain-containing protein n=1 Tax=Streptomyces tsukubensis TaxID=83656 RepID=UPI0036838A2D
MTQDIDGLREELLRRRLSGTGPTSGGAIPRADRSKPLPLSFGQRRLWFLESAEPGSADYTVPLVLRLRGPLDALALHRAWHYVIDRHEVLRTRYRLDGAEPVQEVTDGHANGCPVYQDLSDVSPEGREERARRAVERAARTRLSPADGRVAALQLIRLDHDDHRLVAVFHHIAFDGWSERTFWRDLSSSYREAKGHGPVDLDPLPVQYADYAVWQRNEPDGGGPAESLAYWSERLAGLTPLDLPTDRPRPPLRSTAGDVVAFEVPAALSAAARTLALRHGTTPYVVLLTALQVLLARYTGRTDIAVGAPTAGRGAPGCDDLIGFFVNTVVLRTVWSGRPPFGELLDRNRLAVLDALDHQDVPFERLVERFDPVRDPSRTPLVQVMFGYHETDLETFGFPGVEAEPLDVPGDGAKFDLNLQIESGPDDRMRGFLEYSTALFDRDSAERVVGHLLRLLDSATSDPGAPVTELEHLTPAEVHQLLVGFNDTGRTIDETPVHTVISEQSRLRPSAPAVIADGIRLNFAQMEARANRLAHRLRASGVGPESVVGVNLPRGSRLVVALLAVLKAGAAYVPLEPGDSALRRSYILDDSGAGTLITLRDHADDSAAAGGRVLVLLDDDGPAVDRGDPGEPPVKVDPDSLAYIIYTSGTTGRPKGVMITHRGLINYLRWTADAYAGADGGCALFSSVAFDLVVPNLYTPLMLGRPLHLLPHDYDLADLGPLLLAAGPLSFVKLAPGQLELLNTQLSPEQREALAGLVIAAGDRFTGKLSASWLTGGGRRRLAAEYGPTEITIGNSGYVVEGPVGAELVPIGKPIPNTTAFVLDEDLRPVSLGVVGEVFVGGTGVARGYAGRPGLTAEKFLPDPFSAEPGARMYRTGDLGRVLVGGDFEFAGRIDGQIKIRGYRVEPAEVEQALGEHPGVRVAVVTAYEDPAGHAELIAHIVPEDPGSPVPPNGLREFVSDRLPAYMVPSALVTVDELPLTTNGKVDLRALPVPGRDERVADTPYVLPRTATEQRFAEVWRTVLGVSRIGIHDGFFELGGDSVRAVALVGALRDTGFDITVRDVFEHRTVARLAEAAGEQMDHSLRHPAVPPFALLGGEDRDRLPGGIVDAYPLSRIQLGMVLEMLSSGGEGNYHNVTSYVIRDARPYRADAFQQAVDRVVARHEVLRTSMDLTSFTEPLQLVHEYAKLPVGSADLRMLDEAVQEEAVRDYMAAQRERLFRLSDVPLFRFFVHEHRDYWRVTFTEFHPILEGWSLHLMLMEILDTYRDVVNGVERPPEPAPSLRYADFVALERRELEDPGHARYWQDTVARFPRLVLPSAWGSGAGTIEQIYVRYDEYEAGLRELARRADVPLKSVMHAAHLKVMSMLTPEPSFSSGLVCDTRPEAEGADRVYGMYLNTVPFPFRRGARSWTDLVRQVFATEVELWPHRRFPSGDIRREEGGRRVADVCFAYLDFHAVDTDLVDFEAGFDDSPNEFPLMVTTHTGVLSLTSRPQDMTVGELHRLGEMYRSVLRAMATDPEGDARRTFPPAADRAVPGVPDLLSAPPEGTAHGLVERQAAAAPGATAVEHGETRLTYRELSGRANQLAHRLRQLGAGPETVVAVRLGHSVDLVVALLAVLKSGSAFLAVDPGHPAERYRPVLEQAAPVAVLEAECPTSGEPVAGAVRLGLDRERQTIAALPVDGVPPRITHGGELAYVIQTSGSTGRPKGVLNTHKGLVNEVRWAREHLRLGPDDVVLQKTPTTFDVSVHEMLLPLVAGARLVVASPDSHRDPHALTELVRRHRVTVAHFVPAMLALFLEVPGVTDACASLRRLVVSGEALTPELRDRCLTLLPRAALHNLYGPAETAIHVTAWECSPDDRRPLVPIGTPAAHTLVEVRDDELEQVPVGVAGELCVGGEAVGRGYLADARRTAESFVPDPFGPVPGGRLYRTGDQARRLAGGELEYLGRRDRQIKLHGVRIEPGEIEAVLREHEAVTGTLVVARPDDRGVPRLVAYVVPAAGKGRPASSGTWPLGQELRNFLRGRLPDAMVPDAVVPMDGFPLNANGKVDRRALPAPMPGPVRHAVPPRTRTELELLLIWEQVLGATGFGVEHGFFELGGNSLLGIRLLTTVNRALGVRLPVASLLEQPTVAAQAAIVDGPAGGTVRALVSLKGGTRPPLFCVHPMGGTLFCYADFARSLPEELPLYGIQAAGVDGSRPRHRSVESMAADYLAKARPVHPGGPWRLAGWSFGGLVAHEMARMLVAAGEDVELLVLLDPTPPRSDDGPPTAVDEPTVLSAFLRYAGRLHGTDNGPGREALERMRPADRRAAVLARMREAQLLLPGEGMEGIDPLIDVFTANWHACAQYRPGTYTGRTLLIRPGEAGRDSASDSWERLCAGPLHTTEVPGDHFDVVTAPNIVTVAAEVARLTAPAPNRP